MVKIAKSLDKDIDFVSKLQILEQHIVVHNTLPNHINDKKLYNFIIKLRQKHRQDPNLCFWEWRVPMLMKLGIDITSSTTINNVPSPSNIEPHWRNTLDQLRNIVDNAQLNTDLFWFEAIIATFKKRQGFLKQKRYKTFQELIVKWIQVGDIKPSECTRKQPAYDLRHTLSYICSPLSFLETSQPLVPSWRLKDYLDYYDNIAELPTWSVPFRYGNTVYFGPSSFDPKMFEGALREMPQWMIKMHNREISPKGYNLVRLIKSEVDFFDPIPYSKGGQRSYSKGFDINTQSKVASPRRLNLYDKVNDFHWDENSNCHVQDGYSYSLTITLPMFYGGRSIEKYPEIAKLKVNIWKKVYHWLTPLSKTCPPNGVQALLYAEEFGGKIQPHQDMNVNMGVDPKTNSQIIGSSVIVVNFFDEQIMHMCTRVKAQKKQDRFPTHDHFRTEHCSVYVLDPHDDSLYHHTTSFPATGNRKHHKGLRCALTFRWLGNRRKYFGPDNPAGLQHCQVVTRPYHEIDKKYPKSENARAMWKQVIAHKKDKKKEQDANVKSK